jgi:hypothetical protein
VIVGCDFSSTPTRRKPIVLAFGELVRDVVVLQRIEPLTSLAAFADWLNQEGDWIGGFDFPFGLPRELVEHLGWPLAWRECITHYASFTRELQPIDEMGEPAGRLHAARGVAAVDRSGRAHAGPARR